jgi:hypothetical protein
VAGLHHLAAFCVSCTFDTLAALATIERIDIVHRFIRGTSSFRTIVASEPDRPDRGTGSRNGVRHAGEQGSVRGTHLWYAKLDRGSRSTFVSIDEAESRVLIIPNMMLEIEDINRPKYDT